MKQGLLNKRLYTLWTTLICRNFKFSDVHVAGARSIAEACSAAGVKRLIHFSALGASRDSPSAFLRSKVLC